jgi:hypothetical protein
MTREYSYQKCSCQPTVLDQASKPNKATFGAVAGPPNVRQASRSSGG